MSTKRLLLGSLLTCGFVCMAGTMPSDAVAGGGHAAAGKKAVRSLLMFKEKHKETYYGGKLKVKGIIAQVCEVPKRDRVYRCPQGSKQIHVKHGTWKWFWPNGKLMAVRHYHIGHLDGVSKSWFASGLLRSKAAFEKGKQIGTATSYYAKGKKKLVEQFENGLRNGKSTSYWWNGKMSAEGKYKNGKRTGTWRTFYINGDVKTSTVYVNGQRHGAYVLYRSVCQPTGCGSLVSVQGSYKNGLKHGTWNRWYYDANGAKKNQMQIWKDGRKEL